MPSTATQLPSPDVLLSLGEYFAAGYFEMPSASPMLRWSRALRRYFENRTPEAYAGQLLYPAGPQYLIPKRARGDRILQFGHSFTWFYFDNVVDEFLPDVDETQRETLEQLRTVMREETERNQVIRTLHTVGGGGYTHSIPNYGRVITEGLNGHARRIEAGLAKAKRENNTRRVEFYLGLQDVLEGIRVWHGRLIDTLRAYQPQTPDQAKNRDMVLAGLQRIPFEPARNFHEALLAYNMVFYIDGCDNPGRVDRVLLPYYLQDVKDGRLDYAAGLKILRQFVENICANYGWSQAIGGSNADGSPAYNELTHMCIEATQHRFRPSLELCVRRDMPDSLWDIAMDTLADGCGQPAFYNDPVYIKTLQDLDLGLRPEDTVLWNGGGCTETMIHGLSNVGSIDAGINLAFLLDTTLKELLPQPGVTYEAIVDKFKAAIIEATQDTLQQVSNDQESRANIRPQPIRSLLIDDCIDAGVEFNAGGARYNWSVVNVAGLSNIADSLVALKEVVFDKQEISPCELRAVLDANFEGYEPLRKRLLQCPKFGNDKPQVDAVAREIGQWVCTEMLRHRPWRGGRFLPSCIMFEAYGFAGAVVGATPDGRFAREPLADSIGPVQGRDISGPTAMLRSVTALPLSLAIGTPILNMRFTRDLFASSAGKKAVRHLIETYFAMGGLQIQISVLDREELLDAMEHPEKHEDLIVRIGGYSTHFNWLSPELKREVIRRTEYATA